jgi:glutathione S-transferase
MDLKDISADDAVLDELIEKGGKKMVPFLEDTDRGVSMYESGDIIAYLTEHYGPSAA